MLNNQDNTQNNSFQSTLPSTSLNTFKPMFSKSVTWSLSQEMMRNFYKTTHGGATNLNLFASLANAINGAQIENRTIESEQAFD